MKKILNISVIAALAILPLVANAAVTDAVPGPTVTGDDATAATATTDPKYGLAQPNANVDGVVATAGYVKGAYNAAIKAINKVSETANSAVKGIQVNGADLSLTGGKANVTITEGSANGTVKVNGTDVNVHGLGTAAYTSSDAYATAAQGEKADTAVQSVVEGLTNGTISVDGTDVPVHGLGTAAYTNSNAYDAAGTAAGVQTAIEGKLDDGANGYDIDAKTLKIAGQDVLTNAALTNYATKTGVETTVTNALNAATVDISSLEVTNGGLTGTGTATVPVITTWGAESTSETVSASVSLAGVTTNVGLTGDTTPVTVTAGTFSYPANP